MNKLLFTGVLVVSLVFVAAGCSDRQAAGFEGYRGGRAEPGAASAKEVEPRSKGAGRYGEPAPAASQVPRESSETGSEQVVHLSGTLVSADEEWMLDSGEGHFAVHFGNSAFVESTGIELHDGQEVTIRGHLTGDEVAVISCETDSGIYSFRTEEGMPLWAGRGARASEVAEQECDDESE